MLVLFVGYLFITQFILVLRMNFIYSLLTVHIFYLILVLSDSIMLLSPFIN